MERSQCNSLQNFDDTKTDILKKRLLKSSNTSFGVGLSAPGNSQQNVLLNTLGTPISTSMLMSSVHQSQSSLPVTHNLVTHSIAPMKIHTNNSPYPLQLSTVNVPVQIPGSTSNINVPVHLAGSASSVPLQITGPTVSLPLQMSGTTTNVPVQLPAGGTINVPLQLPPPSQNIQLTAPAIPSMPVMHNTNSQHALHSSIIHVHMGSNSRGNINTTVEPNHELPNTTSGPSVQVGPGPIMHIPSSSPPMQLQLPTTGTSGPMPIQRGTRAMPHVVYIQTPTGLKPVTSTDVISQASTTGNPPQIIVRRPVTSTAGIQLIPSVNNKPNIAPKTVEHNNSSLITSSSTSQPIVIQKPKSNTVPVSVTGGKPNKQTIAYLGTVKKPSSTKVPENQSILIPNNQINSNVNSTSNQKLYLTSMNMSKIQNTKFILPVTLPASMASKGPIINLQIANGRIQNDAQGSITVMRDTLSMDTTEMPPLQPLGKFMNTKDSTITTCSGSTHHTLVDKTFALSIPGSRAEPTGEQEYTLSIPETNASMNDDIYTVSITDDDGVQSRENSFTLSIPEKGKSLLNRSMLDHSNSGTTVTIAAPAILRRSNSDNSDKKNLNTNIKRRISLCSEGFSNKILKLNASQSSSDKLEVENDSDNNDDHRVPSLFCDEKLDKDLESKVNLGESDPEDYKDSNMNVESCKEINNHNDYRYYYSARQDYVNKIDTNIRTKRDSVDSTVEEDPPGLIWNNGIAHLQGSSLQFQTNEFGIIDLIEHIDQQDNFLVDSNSKYHTPLKQRIERTGRDKKPTSPEDLYKCDGCGCHGMAAEFITPNFCSLTCQREVQKAIQKKKDRERTELNKKRNRMKKMLMRKQRSESDLLTDTKDLSSPKTCESTTRLPDNIIKPIDDPPENEKYPWMCGKNGFSWMRYLEFCKAKAAPVKFFKDPFPYNKNGFKVGMRLESIDPMHPSIFCVVSVAEVQGYRLRLHFDEYPEIYDFWVNADSIDIFPPGWCEKNGRSLKPPSGYDSASFSWPFYLKQIRAVAAPRHLFPHMCQTMLRPNGFRIGMKLEAEDRKNNLVCVATVADMLDNRILVNFDSWDEMYDYWVDPTSPYIHPVGWAEENGVSLTPPNFYKDPDTFTWESYLLETASTAVPARAFKTRAPQAFKVGMKLEVVDKRVPFLIRVATITEIKGHQVRISFDGWPEELSYLLDDDSPDLHPVGWCLKTGHPLEPPLTSEELSVAGTCGVGGCRGLGSVHGGAHKTHSAASTCPYRTASPAPPSDRLAPQEVATHVLPRTRKVLGRPPKSVSASTPTSDTPREKLPRGRPPKHKRLEEVTKTESVSDEESQESNGVGAATNKRWRQNSPRADSVSNPKDIESSIVREYDLRVGQQGHGVSLQLSPLLAHLSLSPDPREWSQHEVCSLVSRVVGASASAAVAAAKLSGTELLMTSCEELVDILRLRLGPAVKLHAVVRRLRELVLV